MVVHNLYVPRPIVTPAKADAPLSVDPNAVLPSTVSPKRLKGVTRQPGQVVQIMGTVKHGQATRCLVGERMKARDAGTFKEPSRVPVPETSNHAEAERSRCYVLCKP